MTALLQTALLLDSAAFTQLLRHARELVVKYGDDNVRSRRVLKSQIQRDAALREYAYDLAADDALRLARTAIRRKSSALGGTGHPRVTDAQQERAQRFTEGIYAYVLWGGRAIGDATTADLRDSVAHYDTLIAGSRRARD